MIGSNVQAKEETVIDTSITRLATRLRHAAKAYYDSAELLMTDSEYDDGIERLRIAASEDPSLESEFADLFEAVTGGQSVGGEVTHPSMMGSMNKARSLETIDELLAKVNGPVFVEPKLDGLAIRAVYEHGRLTLVATRGDGYSGEDITGRARELEILPKLIGRESLELRGEVFVRDEDFTRANALRLESAETPFVNQRNAAAGILRRGNPTYARVLSFAAYDVESEVPDLAASTLGVPVTSALVPELGLSTADPSVVRELIAQLAELRSALGYPIDGAVIKAANQTDRDRLGMGTKAPNWAIAYKYEAEQAETIVRAIRTKVGRTGRLSIQVEVAPVFVGGTTIAYASGHNVRWMLNRGIRVGDTVTVSRAGDVIPYLGEVNLDKRPIDARPWVPPETDPVGREWDKSTLLWRSTSPEMTVLPTIEHALGRDALDVEDIGPEIAAALVDSGLVNDIADIFALKRRQLSILRLESGRVVGEKVAARIFSEIDRAKSADWNRVVAALGLRGIGTTLGRRISTTFPTVEDLRNATATDFANVEGVANMKAQTIRESLDDLESRGVLDRLESSGVTMGEASVEDDFTPKPLDGETVVITGKVGSLTRAEAMERIEVLGGRATTSISASTTLLVAPAGSLSTKLRAARDRGIPLMTPDELLEL